MIAAGSLFTSCVENTEPQGIKDLRLAKADYLDALSNLRAADAEKVKAFLDCKKNAEEIISENNAVIAKLDQVCAEWAKLETPDLQYDEADLYRSSSSVSASSRNTRKHYTRRAPPPQDALSFSLHTRESLAYVQGYSEIL